MEGKFHHGIELINQGSYFAAHDELEEVWRGVYGWTKPFYQGMVQVAIAMHHFSTGNLVGARSVMLKARKNLAEFPASFCGVDVNGLLAQVDEWQKGLGSGGPYPPKVIVKTTEEPKIGSTEEL